MKKNLASLLILVLAFSACAFKSGDGQNEQNSAYQKQKQTLEDSFAPVLGTYEGSIIVSNANTDRGAANSIPLQLGIYMEYVSAGKDSQGQDQILPVLRIRYRQMDYIRADEILSARFLGDIGEVTATSNDAKAATNVKANLQGEHLIGEITRSSGKLGVFNLTRVSQDVVSQTDAQRELYDRMVKMNRALQGVYTGNMKTEPDRPETKDFPVKLKIMAVETVENGFVISKLVGYYSRPDFTADPTAGERTLAIDYRLDMDPPRFVMSSSGGTTQIPNAYFMSIVGFIKNNIFTADAYDRRGYIGVLTVKKASR